MLFEYSAEASVRVNWDEQYQMILFDHLIPWPSPFGHGISYLPDGSYDGLRFEKGRWKFVESLQRHAGRGAAPEPVLDSRQGKDIMGKDKKQKKGSDAYWPPMRYPFRKSRTFMRRLPSICSSNTCT